MGTGAERYEGTSYTVGGVTYIIPALSFGALKKLRDKINRMIAGEATEDEAQDTTCAIVHAALVRNYPEMTLEFVSDEIVDFRNYRELTQLTLQAAGYVKAPEGKVVAESPQTSVS